MSPAEQERKLRMIAEMPADELAAWEAYVIENRGYFPDEQAAILRRRKQLGARK